MEIIARTERYSAQELQQALNPNPQNPLCIVMGGDQPNEYVIIVDNATVASLIQGALDHLGVSYEK